ncbi:MAG: acyl-CoA desaturase [Chitinophagaceae bacterium]
MGGLLAKQQMLIIITFFIAHWYLSLFAQTFFHHRYAAHGAFTMSKWWEKFWYWYSFITQGSSYMSPRVYAILHRLHHAHTDTDEDPHTPLRSSNALHLMMQTHKRYADIYNGITVVDPKFTKNLPDWRSFDSVAHPWYMRFLWIAVYAAFYIVFAPSAWFYLLIPVHAVMGPLHGTIINWFAHRYGTKNFLMSNTSTNLFYVDVIMLGEAYHNNHHKFPSSINFGVKRNEIDPIYFAILLLNKIGIIKIDRAAQKNIRENGHRLLALQSETKQAV